MKEMPDLICGKAAVGGNYNSTRDNVSIRLPKAQYENLRGFCLLQHSIVTVISPERLIRDVREGLMASVVKLPVVK